MRAAPRNGVPAARTHVPAAPGLPRARLLTALDGVLSARLGLVVAPAGSGKTTLISRWSTRFPGAVVWYRADVVDATPGRFPPSLATAFRSGIGLLPETHDIARLGRRLTAVRSVEDLALAVEDYADRVLLVIDDVHELEGSPALADLERLLLLAPTNLHTVLGTRMLPPFNLARSELPTPVMVVGDDLRFRSWEVEILFRDVFAEQLRPDDAAALARRTEGWAAALQLFHLSIRGHTPSERHRAVDALAGRSRYAQSYLSGQVLAELPDGLRTLMLRTCVFDVLTAQRCDALLASSGSQRALLELQRRRALTTSEDGGLTFRYHEVLRRHLEAMLHEELGEAETRAWYARAAEILEAEGAIVEALRARCRAEDWGDVKRLLHEGGARLAEDSASDWAELLPSWLTQGDPWVSLGEARRLFADGQLGAAELAASRAAEQFTDRVGRERCRALLRTATTWSRAGASVEGRWMDVLRSATRGNPLAAAAAAQRLDPPHADLVEGCALALAGNKSAGRDALYRCIVGPRTPSVTLPARLVIAVLDAFGDDVSTAPAELDSVCLDAERAGLTWLARIARGTAVARGGGPDDVAVAENLAEDCAQRGDMWGAALIRGIISIAQSRNGWRDVGALDALAAQLRALGAGTLEAWCHSVAALAAALNEEPEAQLVARSAEAFARSALVPGAQALAYAALATARAADSELLLLAEETARSVGLCSQPWAWVAGAPGPVSPDAPTGIVAVPERLAPSPSPRIHLSCFGPFRITISGAQPDLSGLRPRARSLLRLLALNAGRPVNREQITDTLWPAVDSATAMHNLQVAVYSLRRHLEPDTPGRDSQLIVREGESYRLALGADVMSDLRAFDAAVADATRARTAHDDATAASALSRALTIYISDVLPEDGAAEWVIDVREHYRVRAADAAATLAELELARGDATAALAAASRGVEIDRFRDPSWRALIAAHNSQGDLAAAERARRAYAEVLSALDLAPSPA